MSVSRVAPGYTFSLSFSLNVCLSISLSLSLFLCSSKKFGFEETRDLLCIVVVVRFKESYLCIVFDILQVAERYNCTHRVVGRILLGILCACAYDQRCDTASLEIFLRFRDSGICWFPTIHKQCLTCYDIAVQNPSLWRDKITKELASTDVAPESVRQTGVTTSCFGVVKKNPSTPTPIPAPTNSPTLSPFPCFCRLEYSVNWIYESSFL